MRYLIVLLFIVGLYGQTNQSNSSALNYTIYQPGASFSVQYKSALLSLPYFNFLLDQSLMISSFRSNESILLTQIADYKKKASLLEEITNSQGLRLYYKDQQIGFLTNALDTTVKYGQVEKTLRTSPVVWFCIGVATAFIVYEVGKNVAFPIVILTNR